METLDFLGVPQPHDGRELALEDLAALAWLRLEEVDRVDHRTEKGNGRLLVPADPFAVRAQRDVVDYRDGRHVEPVEPRALAASLEGAVHGRGGRFAACDGLDDSG